jgi:hypothetical protein
MTIASPPLSPHFALDDVSSQKKRLSWSGFSTLTPVCDVTKDDASTLSPSSDDVSIMDCQARGAGKVVAVQSAKQKRLRLCKRRGGLAVSFALSSNREVASLHHTEFTVEEFRATWYSHQELNEMKMARRALIQHMDLATNNDTDWESFDESGAELCVRGLWGKTKIGRRKRHAEMAAVTAAVLDEQDAQYTRGVFDASVIAYLCEMHTRQSMMRARRLGKKDAVVVTRLLR